MRKTLTAGVVAAAGLGLLPSVPAQAIGPVVAAAVPGTFVTDDGVTLLISGEAVGVGSGGQTRTFAGSCQATVVPPRPDVSVAVFCDVNTERLANTPLGLFTPQASVAVSDVLPTVTASSYQFCIHTRAVGPGVVAIPPGHCVPFL